LGTMIITETSTKIIICIIKGKIITIIVWNRQLIFTI